MLLPSILCAAGIGFSFVPVTIAATAGVERREAGLASGLVNTSRQMGGSVGLALLAAIATQVSRRLAAPAMRQALTDGFTRAFEVGAGIAFTGAVISLLLLVRVRAGGAYRAQLVEEIEPDLAARGERRDRVAQARQRDLADDGDRRRVEEVGDLGSDDRRADDARRGPRRSGTGVVPGAPWP